MSVRACRVCGGAFFDEPLLRYASMPKAAQYLPAAGDLADETGVDLEVCQCAWCGLVQLSGEPVPYYREVIRAAGVSDVIARAKAEQFGAFIEAHGLRGKRVIEIGCGRGEFLRLLGPLDVAAFGLEYGNAAVADCLANGLSVSRGYPGDIDGPLEGAPYDAFLLLMFLEHMPDPGRALRAIHESLCDGAVGLVEVPNFDMVLRRRLFSVFIGDHLLYFSSQTLRTTLELNGFDILECDEVRDDYVLSAVVRRRTRLDISDFREHQQRLTAALAAYVDAFTAKRVAVWGAGHQAFAIMALTGIAGRIRYVVDSADFKQGRFTPATHLPVVAPETLHKDPVDAVIVAAGSYSDEVAAILRREFDPALSVAILRDSGLEIV